MIVDTTRRNSSETYAKRLRLSQSIESANENFNEDYSSSRFPFKPLKQRKIRRDLAEVYPASQDDDKEEVIIGKIATILKLQMIEKKRKLLESSVRTILSNSPTEDLTRQFFTSRHGEILHHLSDSESILSDDDSSMSNLDFLDETQDHMYYRDETDTRVPYYPQTYCEDLQEISCKDTDAPPVKRYRQYSDASSVNSNDTYIYPFDMSSEASSVSNRISDAGQQYKKKKWSQKELELSLWLLIYFLTTDLGSDDF